ncbi:hypothetical protein [Rufibacter soli]|jgi:hypothetical protein
MKLRVTLGITLMLFLNSVTILSDSKGTPFLSEKPLAQGPAYQQAPQQAKVLCAIYSKSVKEKI